MISNSTGPLTHARENLSEIVDRVAATGEAWTITKHGRPAAVILGHEEYESMVETLNILSDASTMDAINEALVEVDELIGSSDAASD